MFIFFPAKKQHHNYHTFFLVKTKEILRDRTFGPKTGVQRWAKGCPDTDRDDLWSVYRLGAEGSAFQGETKIGPNLQRVVIELAL